MVTAITSYQTSDGKKFGTAEEAQAHEALLKYAPEIQAFLDKFYPKPTAGKPGPTRAIAGKAVAAWLAEQA